MGVASSPGPDRPYPARRSIRFRFATLVALPVVCLVVLWGVAVALTPAGAVVRHGLFSRSHPGLTDVAIYAGGALIVVLLAVVLMGAFARRVSRDLSGLEASARHLADEQLPRVIRNLREKGQAAGADQGFTRPRAKTAEVGRTAAAIAGLQHTAVAAAQDEAALRNGVAQVFVSLARRNQSLLQRQLRLIDALEQKAADPAALADLFLLDHLTTRMRRHAENLIILSGEPPGRSWSEPVPVIDVVRGAVAEVEDYQRIRVVTRARDAVTGSAVADMIHLLAELIENAAMFSPSSTRVEVRAERVANGFVVEVEDRGLGIQPALLSDINQQLLDPADFALADPDRLGLFVVGKLAARHGVRVALKPSPYGGTTAVALIPHSVVVPAAEPAISGPPDADGPAALDRRSRDALVLTGRHAGVPAPADDADPPPAVWDGGGLSLARDGSAGRDSSAGREGSAGRDSFLSPGSRDSSADTFSPGSRDSSPDTFSLGSRDSSPGSLSPAGSPGAPSSLGPGSSPGYQSPFSPGSSPSPFSLGRDSSPGTFSPGSRGSSADTFSLGSRDGSAVMPGRSSSLSPGGPDRFPSPFSRGTAAPDTAAEDTSAPDTPAAGTPAGGTYRGLPRRVRQASLSQHLRDNPAPDAGASPGGPAPEPSGERTPEKARDFVASFRTGWQRDNETDAPDRPHEAGPGTAAGQDSGQAHGEGTLWTSAAPPVPARTSAGSLTTSATGWTTSGKPSSCPATDSPLPPPRA